MTIPKDAERSQFLMSLGLEILRFSNRDIDKDFRNVCAHKLILSFEKGCKTLSVTCGDSSPIGRAEAVEKLGSLPPSERKIVTKETHQGCLSFAITGFSELKKF